MFDFPSAQFLNGERWHCLILMEQADLSRTLTFPLSCLYRFTGDGWVIHFHPSSHERYEVAYLKIIKIQKNSNFKWKELKQWEIMSRKIKPSKTKYIV